MKKLLMAALLGLMALPAQALNVVHGKAFDEWVSGVYSDRSALGPAFIERDGDTAYFVQGGNLIPFEINDVTIVSPIQIKAVMTNQLGGVYSLNRVGGTLEIFTPNGQTMRLLHVRSLLDNEREVIISRGGGGAGSKSAAASSSPAIQASFDCAKASTRVEKMICSDAALAELDTTLAARYESVLQMGDDKAYWKQDQRKWVKERNQCQQPSCLAHSYNVRIQDLEQVLQYLNKPAEYR